MGRIAYVVASTLVGTPALAAVGGVPSEHVSTLGLLAGLVALVASGIAWVDSRVEKAIRTHATNDELRHQAVLGELAHLREMIARKGRP